MEARSKKLNIRKKQLETELEQRQNTKELERKTDQLQSILQELERLDAAENLSTGEVLEDLDVKIGVAMSEIQKWINNSFLLA